MLVDTHCHIHESTYEKADDALERAAEAGVTRVICVGTDETTSRQAVEFALARDDVLASIGVHPHESKDGFDGIRQLAKVGYPSLVAIGEIGLDYFYAHSPRLTQTEAFESQLQVAVDYNLPVIFHVREAFDDFWPILRNFSNIRGVLHSFTDTAANLDIALEKGFYIGLNGISTFTKDPQQQRMFSRIPLDRMLLETDSPFLTPAPHRGKVNEPAFVRNVAEYHAKRREVELEHLARVTSANASTLFSL